MSEGSHGMNPVSLNETLSTVWNCTGGLVDILRRYSGEKGKSDPIAAILHRDQAVRLDLPNAFGRKHKYIRETAVCKIPKRVSLSRLRREELGRNVNCRDKCSPITNKRKAIMSLKAQVLSSIWTFG